MVKEWHLILPGLQTADRVSNADLVQNTDCRLSLKCRLRPKLSHRLIRDIFSMYELVVIILRVTQCRSRNLFRENFLLGLFNSKKIIVTIENLYLFFNMKHKYLVRCFTLKAIRIEAF